MAVRQEDTASRPQAGERRIQGTGFRPDIEGLRAIAVIAVVLYHAGIPGVGGGYIGVDVFFVISGFLITGLLWREVTTTNTVALGRFYAARARRLLPAAAAVGVLTAIAAAVVLPPLQARRVFMDGIASALYVGNYRFASQGTDYLISDLPPSPFQHYWSLGVEEQFYLLWPALIIGTAWLVRRARKDASGAAPYAVVMVAVAAASLAAAVVCTRTSPTWAFFSLPTRAWELAAGGLVALSIRQWRRLPLLPAAVAGWAAGMASGTAMAASLHLKSSVYPLHLPAWLGGTYAMYAAVPALLLNFAVSVLLTLAFRAAGLNSGTDSTDASAYVG